MIKQQTDRMEACVNGKWLSVPVVKIDDQALIIQGKWFQVASLHDEEWLEKEVKDPLRCIAALRGCRGKRPDVFTFTQKPPATEIRYEFARELVSVAVARVGNFKEWWESLPQETRKNVRRAQKRGVEIRVQPFTEEVVRGIAEVQNESPIRQGRRYPHFGKSLNQVQKDHSGFAERSDFVCAYCGEEFIGFLKLVYRGNLASILQLNSKIAHYDKRPSNALLAKAVELCAARGVSHLTYGRFNYGNKNDSSLRDFKIRNGFCDTLVPRYYVPLTLWGRVYANLKLYRGLMGLLPPSAIATFVRLRAKWYDRRMSKSRCSSMLERPNRDRQMGRSNPPAGSNTPSEQSTQEQSIVVRS